MKILDYKKLDLKSRVLIEVFKLGGIVALEGWWR